MNTDGKPNPSTARVKFTKLKLGHVCLRLTHFFKVASLFVLLGAAQNIQAQSIPKDMFNQPLMIDSLRGLVMATPFTVGSNSEGGYLRLPDGSVIHTVWPAALGVNSIDLGGQPVWPRCEPAVYSLARIMPNGRELWAKSYIRYSREIRKIEACDSDRFDFKLYSAISEVGMPGYYEMTYRNRIFQGIPGDSRGMFVLNPDTGNVDMDDPPKNLRVIDAYELRKLKLRIVEEVARDMAPILRGNKKLNPEFIHKREEYKRLEKALFPKSPPSKP